MASTPVKKIEPHEVVLRALKNYTVWETLVSQTGKHVLSWQGYDISFFDLQNCLKGISPRKQEAIYYNVILDMKQKDAAENMGITTVSVGQYVKEGCRQIAERLFVNDEMGRA